MELPAATNPVSFADTNLQSIVRKSLNVATQEVLTAERMLDLTNLFFSHWEVSSPVTNLSGLEHATNLEAFSGYLSGGISLAPLQSLPRLTYLGMSGGLHQDAVPLLALTNVMSFQFRERTVTNLMVLAAHPSLLYFHSDGGVLTDATPFASFHKLISLGFPNNLVRDVRPLLGLTNLTSLGLRGNPLTNAPLVAALTNLNGLDLPAQGLTHCDFLTNLWALDYLAFSQYHQINDLSPIGKLDRLAALNLSGGADKDLSFVTNLTRLDYLDLSYSGLKQLPALAALTNVTWLLLHNNHLQNLNGVAGMPNLEILWASQNWLTNIAALTNCPKLLSLSVWGNFLNNSVNQLDPSNTPVVEQVNARENGHTEVGNQGIWGTVRLSLTHDFNLVRVKWEPSPTNIFFTVQQSTNAQDWVDVVYPNWPGLPYIPEITVPIEERRFFRTVLDTPGFIFPTF